MVSQLRVISSMATRLLLEDLLAEYCNQGNIEVTLEPVGGVDAARRIGAGEYFDVAVLSSKAIAKLDEAESIVAGSAIDLFISSVAVGVAHGRAHLPIGSEEQLRRAVREAESIGYSTGPSGDALKSLFERWGIADEISARVVVPPPGVPVGSLIASGEVALGFQQYAELVGIDGIELLGSLPDPVGIETVFSGCVCVCSRNRDRAARLLEYLHSSEIADEIVRHGMTPA